jgi:hypothetical protein
MIIMENSSDILVKWHLLLADMVSTRRTEQATQRGGTAIYQRKALSNYPTNCQHRYMQSAAQHDKPV